MTKLTFELIVSNVKKSLAFYVDTLGFQKAEGDFRWARLKLNNSELLLMAKSDFDQEIPSLNRPQNSGWSVLVIEVDDINTIHEKLISQVKILRTLTDTDYGTREFTIEDPDGYLIQLTQRKS